VSSNRNTCYGLKKLDWASRAWNGAWKSPVERLLENLEDSADPRVGVVSLQAERAESLSCRYRNMAAVSLCNRSSSCIRAGRGIRAARAIEVARGV
jgi:hypothetical protein